MAMDINLVRSKFPALKNPHIFLDNPGGTQVPLQCIDRINEYFLETNANSGGVFETSQRSDATVEAARSAMADFLNANRPEEVAFGMNMTTLTYSVSRAIGKTFLKAGDTIVITRLDHDGNISPWLQLADDYQCNIRWVDINPDDCTINVDDFKAAMTENPKVVAFGYASNISGTINPVKELAKLAHDVGAMVYIDAVQYAPHGPMDVQDLGVDFLVCSSYKFFGPHLGILWGNYDLLDQLKAYRVRPSSNVPPGKFETGTGPFESIAGLLGTLEYLEWLSDSFGADQDSRFAGRYSGRRLTLKKAMGVLQSYEHELSRTMMESFSAIPGLQLHGIADVERLNERVPTYSFTHPAMLPKPIAIKLAEQSINVWAGNFYALAVTTRLGLEGKGGMLRIGAAHYNTKEEIETVTAALKAML